MISITGLEAGWCLGEAGCQERRHCGHLYAHDPASNICHAGVCKDRSHPQPHIWRVCIQRTKYPHWSCKGKCGLNDQVFQLPIAYHLTVGDPLSIQHCFMIWSSLHMEYSDLIHPSFFPSLPLSLSRSLPLFLFIPSFLSFLRVSLHHTLTLKLLPYQPSC